MLTDLNWLQIGNKYPPSDFDTKNRLNKYEDNRRIFEGEHLEIFKAQFKRIERVIGNFENVITYGTLLNFQKLISLKTADLLFGENPIIESKNKEEIKQLITTSKMFDKLYEVAIDVSRFGDGLVYVYIDNEEGATFCPQNPQLWIPIVDKFNAKKIVNHVLCWKYKDGENSYLKAQIHYKGYFEERLYLLSNSQTVGTVIHSLIESDVVKTGIDDFAVIHTSNLTTSDKITGFDDYSDINDIIIEIMVRIAQISRILDKHSSPSVSGPMSALEKDPASGMWSLKMGNYFPKDSADDAEVKYITWDGQLEASFKQIETLTNQLYLLSEMGTVLLGGDEKGGANISGRALRLKMISPLSKVKRLSRRFDYTIKNILSSLAKLYNLSINIEDITINWQDGLPNDAIEEAEIMNIRTGNKQTMSLTRALRTYDYMTEEQAEEELETILEEEKMLNPLMETDFKTEGDNVEEVDEEEEKEEVDAE